MSSNSRTPLTLSAWVLGACVVWSCAGSASGLSCLGPLPLGRYQGPRNDNAINLRLSAAGIAYLNSPSNFNALIEPFVPGRVINFPVPCTLVDTAASGVNLVGLMAFADQGNSGGAGRMDGQCTSADTPANVRIQVMGFRMTPKPAEDALELQVDLTVDTGRVYVSSADDSLGICLWLSGVKASVRFNTGAQSPAELQVRATIKFRIDPRWDQLLAFDVTNVIGAGVCGASGVPSAPACLQPGDVDFSGENNCGSVYLTVLEIDWIKSSLLRLMNGPLQAQVQAAVSKQGCMTCGPGLPGCPNLSGATSACQQGICVDQQTSKCVPRFLGVEGRLPLAPLLGSFGAPPEAALDLSIALAGQPMPPRPTVDTGINLGIRAGINAVNQSSCVPAQAPPSMIPSAPPDFDLEAPAGMPYHVGLGLSSSFLNQAFHHLHQSGAFCLQLSTANVGLINTGLFKTFLPSLGKLAARTAKDDSGNLATYDAPMLVSLRPARPPQVTVGLGTVDPMTHKPIQPLLTLLLPELSVDFYALLDDRYARLFTLKMDLALPLALTFEGCDKVTPALGDVRMLISNISTDNSELLAEDPSVLADLIPAVIGLAEPALAGALQPFTLPALGPLKLKVNGVKGVSNLSGTQTYLHLGLFASLVPQGSACAVAAPNLKAKLGAVSLPKAEEMRLAGHALPLPKVALEVQATGLPGSVEYAYKIDQGLWSTFLPAPAGVLEVSHPALLLQGKHVISVRARLEEQPHGVSSAIEVPVVIDWDPPELTLTPQRSTNRFAVAVRDVIDGERVELAYALGEDAFSEFGPPREVSLAAAERAGKLRVRARDASGNVAEASWTAPQTIEHESIVTAADEAPARSGCSAAPGLTLLALACVARLRRRRSC